MSNIKEVLNKFYAGEILSEEEIEDFMWESEIINEETGESHRWQTPVSTIVNVEGRFYCIEWMKGNTEYQPNTFPEQPYEVEPYIETITIIRYRPV